MKRTCLFLGIIVVACGVVMAIEMQRVNPMSCNADDAVQKMQSSEVVDLLERDLKAGMLAVRERSFRSDDMTTIVKRIKAGKFAKDRAAVADLFVLWEQWTTETFGADNRSKQYQGLKALLEKETTEDSLRQIVLSIVKCSGRAEAYSTATINEAEAKELRSIGNDLLGRMAKDLEDEAESPSKIPEGVPRTKEERC